MKILMDISVGSYLTISTFSQKTGIDYSECAKVLEELSKGGFLTKLLAVRCPECGLMLDTVRPEEPVLKTQYCANCDANYDISDECIEVVFKVVKLREE